jgi:hypothetical protein
MMGGKELGDLDVRVIISGRNRPAPEKIARCTQSATLVARSKMAAISFA